MLKKLFDNILIDLDGQDVINYYLVEKVWSEKQVSWETNTEIFEIQKS